MRQTIRAFGWATKIFWVVIAAFMITCLYSAMILAMNLMTGEGPFGQADITWSNGTTTLSLPFRLNNTGFYDISDLNITTHIADYNGTSLSTSTTFIPLIPHGSHIAKAHNISISLDEFSSRNLTHLLFNSGNFSVEIFAGLRFAHIFPFQISFDVPFPWGAPLNNFSIGEISFDYTGRNIIVPLGFKNESPYFDVSGSIHFYIYNHEDNLVDSGMTALDVESGESYAGPLELSVSPSLDLLELEEGGRIHFVFEVSIFDFEEEIVWGDDGD